MAARVTKLFLQTHREHATPSAAHGAASSTSKAKAAKLVALGKKPAATDAAKDKKTVKRSKKPSAKRGKKAQEHFLDAARRELAQADHTRENIRKLCTKTPPKTQKLMAKVRTTDRVECLKWGAVCLRTLCC